MRCNTATKALKDLEEMVTSLSVKKCPVRLYLGANKSLYLHNWMFSLEKEWIKEGFSDYARWLSRYVILVQCLVKFATENPTKVKLSCSTV